MSFIGVLTLIFITLKLLGLITWSWWWVLSPILIPSFIGLFILFVAGISALLIARKG